MSPMRDDDNDKQTTRKDRATQLLICETMSIAIPISVSPYQVILPGYREWPASTQLFNSRGSTDTMAAIAMKVVDKTRKATMDTKQHIDEALTKVSSQTWSEPLGKACSVTGSIVSGLGIFVPGLGILGGALSLGSKVLNPTISLNDLRREQEPGCIACFADNILRQ